MKRFLLVTSIFLLLGGSMSLFAENKPINIAHRGACGYLPEHTLPAKAMAHAMNADFIEQDVVLTRDDVPVVIHDIHLDTVTDVATRFPDRARADGRFYVIDFTLAEVKTLKVSERFDLKSKEAVFAGRFPLWKSDFRLSCLSEELELIQGLNKSTGKNIGIYPEIKEPAWHREQGKDISTIVLKMLADYDYSKAEDNIFLQCFDFAELKRIKNDLKCQLKLILLIEEECNLEEVAACAYGIGPSISQILTGIDKEGKPVTSDLVDRAHHLNLKVHPYTFRPDSLPGGITGEALLKILFEKVKIDGIFSDFPDVSGSFLRKTNK